MDMDKLFHLGLENCFTQILQDTNVKNDVLESVKYCYAVEEEWNVNTEKGELDYVKLIPGQTVLKFQQIDFFNLLLTTQSKDVIDLFIKNASNPYEVLLSIFLNRFRVIIFFLLPLCLVIIFFIFAFFSPQGHQIILGFIIVCLLFLSHFKLKIINFNNKILNAQNRIEMLCRNWILLVRHLKIRKLKKAANEQFEKELSLFLFIYKYAGPLANGSVINTDIKELCTAFNLDFNSLVIKHIM